MSQISITPVYSRIENIRPRLNLPKVGTPAKFDESQDDIISIHQVDVDNEINGMLRQKLGKTDKDGRLFKLPLTQTGSKIRITNPKSEFHELEIETVSAFGKITVVKKFSNLTVPTRTFEPHDTPPASFHSISVKDNTDANQRLDALDGFEIGAVIAMIKSAGETINVQHNSAIDNRFITLDTNPLALSENSPFYFEKKADADGGSWYQLESTQNIGGFNSVTIPMDSRLFKKAEDLVIGSYRRDTAENDKKYDDALLALQNHLDERFGITINIAIDPLTISEGSDQN